MGNANRILIDLIYQEENKKAIAEAQAALENMTEAEKEAARAADEASRASKGQRMSLVELKAGIDLAGQAVDGLKKVWDFAKEGAELEYSKIKFDNLTKSIGGADSVLQELRAVTKGTRSDMELMGSAGDFMSLGLAKSRDEVVRLTRVAGALNMDMNQLVLTLANKTTMRFDQLGVAVDGFDARVKELEKSGLDVNKAFTQAFLEQAEKQILKVGDAADTTVGKMQKVETTFKNLGDEVKKFFAEGVSTGIDVIEFPAKLSEAFAESASNIRRQVLDGTMSLEDYNAALKGMSDNVRGVLGDAAVQAALDFYKLDESMVDASQTMDATDRAARRAAEGLNKKKTAAEELAYQGMKALSDSQKENKDVDKAWQESVKKTEEVLRNNERAAKEATATFLSYFKTIQTDAVGVEKYTQSQFELNKEAGLLRLELEKLEAAQGRMVTAHSKGALSANEAQLATLKLAQAQGKLASETDPLKQAALNVQIEKLQEKLGGATSATTAYVDNSKRIGEVTEKLDGVKAKIYENQKAHEEATKQWVLDMLTQKLAVDGLTEAEQKALLLTAEKMGLISSDTVAAIEKVNALAASFDGTAAGARKLARDADAAAKAIAGIPRDLDVNINLRVGGGGRPVGDDALESLYGNGTTIKKPTTTVKPGSGRSGGRPIGDGFASGANFLVPSGYPNDTYPLRVSSGERVIVLTQQQQRAATNNFNMTINAQSAPNVINEFALMRAMAGV